MAVAVLLALVSFTAAGPAAAKGKKGKNPFRHEDPRWQISAVPSYSLLLGYDGRERRGGGAGLSALVQLTTEFSLVVEAGWSIWERKGGAAEDRSPSQAVTFKGFVRYDLDVIHWRPWLAVGGSIAIFPAGMMRDLEVERAGVAVASNWGPAIAAGLDWRPVRPLTLGVVLDICWLLKYRPLPGKDWPSTRSLGIRVGVHF
jgi:hypothetical protein